MAAAWVKTCGIAQVPYCMHTSIFERIMSLSKIKRSEPCTLLPLDRFVGSCALQRGLMKLGIGVSTELAGELLQELGGAAHFTASDLASFARHGVGDGKVGVRSSRMRPQLHQGKTNMAGGLFPSQGESSVVVQTSESIVRRQNNEAEDGRCKPYTTIPQQDDPEQRIVCSARMGRAGEETAQSDVLRGRSSSKYPSPKFRWDELPCWARQSSRTALQELMGHHQR